VKPEDCCGTLIFIVLCRLRSECFNGGHSHLRGGAKLIIKEDALGAHQHHLRESDSAWVREHGVHESAVFMEQVIAIGS
jgi:hypothetical protein